MAHLCLMDGHQNPLIAPIRDPGWAKFTSYGTRHSKNFHPSPTLARPLLQVSLPIDIIDHPLAEQPQLALSHFSVRRSRHFSLALPVLGYLGYFPYSIIAMQITPPTLAFKFHFPHIVVLGRHLDRPVSDPISPSWLEIRRRWKLSDRIFHNVLL